MKFQAAGIVGDGVWGGESNAHGAEVLHNGSPCGWRLCGIVILPINIHISSPNGGPREREAACLSAADLVVEGE